jgi:sulfofructose kinase
VKPADLEGADAVLADMRWPSGALAALTWARTAGVPAILDCDHDPAGNEALLDAADHLLFALPTLQAFTGRRDAADALAAVRERTGRWVGATAGEAGVFWDDGGGIHHLPAFPIAAVDTLGAGDVFHGAFALALAERVPIDAALRFAAAAAAIKCTRFGGRDGIPTRTEVVDFLEEQA